MDARDPSNVDPALLDLFRAELDTHLPVLSDGLLALEKGHVDEPMIAAMMRAAHSIKGAARIVGFTPAVRVAHALEDCFTAARDQRVPLTSAAVDVLLDGVDTLQRVCAAQPENPPDEAMLASLLARIAAVREGRAEKRAAAAPPAPAPAACGAGGEVRVTLPGELDEAAAERLRVELNAALAAGARQIRLDFTAVRHMSTAGLAVLLALTRELGGSKPGPALAAEGLNGPVTVLARISGLDRAWVAGG